MMKKRLASMTALSVLTLIAVLSPPAATQTPPSKVAGAPKELRVGIVTLLSGPASSTFGIPAKKAADAWVEKINDEGGIGGAKLVPVLTDEAGPGDKVVAEFRRLPADEKVDLVIGYISSANCVAVPAVAEELPDLAAVHGQRRVRGLFRERLVIHNLSAFPFKEFRDLPEGFVVGFRGTHWPEVPDPAKNPLQKEFVERCTKKFGEPCGSPHGSYHMVQALQGVKAAYEKAIKTTGRWPGVEDVVRAFEYLEFDSPSGRIAMAVGSGHQAIEDSLYGTVKLDAQKKQNVLTSVRVFPAKCVNAPDGVKTLDWIDQGFRGAQCP